MPASSAMCVLVATLKISPSKQSPANEVDNSQGFPMSRKINWQSMKSGVNGILLQPHSNINPIHPIENSLTLYTL